MANGWVAFDDPTKVQAGDIAVQNGQGDGGPLGDASNNFESHVGIVEQNQNGSFYILSNGDHGARDSNGLGIPAFGVTPSDLFFSGVNSLGTTPSRFYRYVGK